MNLDKVSHQVHKAVINDTMEQDYKRLASLSMDALFLEKRSSISGITSDEANRRLAKDGKNTASDSKSTPWYIFLLESFLDEFIIVLLVLSAVTFFLNDPLGAGIIVVLAVISAMIRFTQSYSAYRQSQKLKTMLHNTVDVRRDGATVKMNIEDIVNGDIVELGTGSIIPADLRIIESRDLFVAQSMFTGESVPVEKKAGMGDAAKSSTELENIALMGCTVISGSGVGIIVKTGKATYLGHISGVVEQTKEKTNFEKGLSKVTNILVIYMAVIVVSVFFINGIIKGDWLQAIMFSISVAVGITPGMLPMIVNTTLSKGAGFLAKKKTIVKNINSIQNLGAIDVLCTDKTGTLTIDNVVLQRYMNIEGEDDLEILNFAFVNSYYSTGIKNLIDRAIISYGVEHGVKNDTEKYVKIDEIPFDYERKRMSVVIKDEQNNHRIITKGAVEEILKICAKAKDKAGILPITDDLRKKINDHADSLSNEGMHVIAIAEKDEYAGVNKFSINDECDMVFIGYVAFLDPPKPDVSAAIRDLYDAGIEIKVLTGDSPLVAEHICSLVGMKRGGLLKGADIETMSEEELKIAVEKNNIFARLAPMQKRRVVMALRGNGHVVGYMGDGVNDAPSLRQADVGISVDSATDIAKESSDIILLEKSLSVLKDGIYEGRRIYGNIMKYMKMALSSNFGNVFSVLVASIFLPFLPMVPIQILIQNLIYDLSQITIPWDNVDPEFLLKPKKWNIKGLSRFMNTMGITSSLFDVATFMSLWFILGYNGVDKQAFFQTGWFIEGLISQTLIVHFIRTSKIPFIQSRADTRLTLSTLGCIGLALAVPILFQNVTDFHFAAMPAEYYVFLLVILAGYAVFVEFIKRIYIRVNKEWL